MFEPIQLHVYHKDDYKIWDGFEIERVSPDIDALRDFLILKCEQDFQRWKNGVEQWGWFHDEMAIYGLRMKIMMMIFFEIVFRWSN
jgi:hypothetical protein